MQRTQVRTLAVALQLVTALGLAVGCRAQEQPRAAGATSAAASAPAEPAGPPSPEVQAAVQGVLDAGRHPSLTWPDVTGVLPDLKALYAAEPDGLFWFAGDAPHPALAGALETSSTGDALGLVPKDYDAPVLVSKWETTRAGADATPAGRARFDVALTVSAMRLLQSAHWGRVDPRLVGFDYDVTLQAARPGRGAARGPRQGRPSRGRRRRRAAVPGLSPAGEGPRRLPRAGRGGRAGAGAGARRRAEEGRAGQALGGRRRARRATARIRRPARGRPGARDGRRRHARSTTARSWTR